MENSILNLDTDLLGDKKPIWMNISKHGYSPTLCRVATNERNKAQDRVNRRFNQILCNSALRFGYKTSVFQYEKQRYNWDQDYDKIINSALNQEKTDVEINNLKTDYSTLCKFYDERIIAVEIHNAFLLGSYEKAISQGRISESDVDLIIKSAKF